MTKEFLQNKGLDYIGYDVTTDKQALSEMKEISGGLSVPVIVIDDNPPIVGFNKERLEELLQD